MKKRKNGNLQRIIEVEHGHFSPLIFGTKGGIGKECDLFLKKLANGLSKKQDESYSSVMTWLRTKLSFEILKSVQVFVRGSRPPFKKPINEEITDPVEDCALNVFNAGL